MSVLSTIAVSSRHQQQQFLDLPWKLYARDPNWIPPLRQNQKELLNYKGHPFYLDAEIQTFVALREDQPVGRVAAILNHAHNRRHNEQRGFFGFFECIDDDEVAGALFEAVRAWFAERDVALIRGPTNPSFNYETGLLVEGFDTPPFFMMTYNRPYYERLITGCGFEKSQDLFAYWGHTDMLAGLDKKLEFVVKSAKDRFDINVRCLDKSRFRQEVEMFLNLWNESMAGTWGFVPLSRKEIIHLAAGMRHLIIPELAIIAEVNGSPIGATFALLDYNPRIKQIDGRLFPFGFLKLIARRRKIKNFRIIAANVLPEYQRWGVGLVLLNGLLPLIYDWGIQEVEFSWILESNQLSWGSLERGGAKRSKVYRVYDYQPPSR